MVTVQWFRNVSIHPENGGWFIQTTADDYAELEIDERTADELMHRVSIELGNRAELLVPKVIDFNMECMEDEQAWLFFKVCPVVSWRVQNKALSESEKVLLLPTDCAAIADEIDLTKKLNIGSPDISALFNMIYQRWKAGFVVILNYEE